MNDELVGYLSKNTSLPPKVIHAIVEKAIIKNYTKGSLLQIGECCLVLKGCIRNFLIIDGEEKTIEFYTEGQPVSPCFQTNPKNQNGN